jgi:hypothetical protein
MQNTSSQHQNICHIYVLFTFTIGAAPAASGLGAHLPHPRHLEHVRGSPRVQVTAAHRDVCVNVCIHVRVNFRVHVRVPLRVPVWSPQLFGLNHYTMEFLYCIVAHYKQNRARAFLSLRLHFRALFGPKISRFCFLTFTFPRSLVFALVLSRSSDYIHIYTHI